MQPARYITLDGALSEASAGIGGGLADIRPYNLPGNLTTAQRQEHMAPAKRRDGADDPSEISTPPRETRPSFFLRTKLLPPRPTPELLSRTRLTDRLLANLSSPLTLVTANAGSGKTTLVADFLRTHKRQFVWYQLDHTDTDPSVFLGYLTFGIQQQVPGFGEVMFSYLQEATGELAQHPERAVDVFLNEVLERVEQQLILVLDDYHHLGADTAVHAVVDRLLAYLPDVLHVIVVSREVPPLALGRLRTHSPLANIDRSDLLFTDGETQELFRKVFDLELTTDQLSEYRERTHGWITALQLVRQVAHRSIFATGTHQTEVPDLVEVLRQSERDIFDYFAEEVFSDESEEVRSLLLQVSLLDRIELDTCATLYPGSNCARLLPGLVRRNVFLTVASDRRGEEYRLHPLFQNFLRRRLRSEIGRSGVAAEHQRYAAHFLQQGLWEQGVRHLLAAEDFDRAASVVAEKGLTWISSGALASLVSLADSLPASSLEAYPRVLVYRAEVARLRGENEFALSILRRAIALLHERGDHEGEADALHSVATIARRDGDFNLAFSYLDRAIKLSDSHSTVRIKCGNTRGLCLVALGEWTAAELEFRTALQLAEEQNDEHYVRLIAHNLGTPAGIRGDFGEALRWLSRMLRNDRTVAPMPQEAVAHLNMARCYLYQGQFAASAQHLDQSLEKCQLFNLVAVRAETLEAYGNLYREQQEIERAAEYYERAARAYGEAGIGLDRTELLEERALLNLQLGDFASAQAQIERLLNARPREEYELVFFSASLIKGRILSARGDHRAAFDILKNASEYLHSHGVYYQEAQASFALAICSFNLGKEPEMIERLRRAVDLAVRYDYEYWLERQVTSHPELFSHEETLELLPLDLREQVQSVRQPTPAPAPVQVSSIELATKVVTDLTVNMLGPVQILRDPTRPLAGDAWSTRRARDIFCFIISRRHHRASKDTIIDTFWGETDFEAVEKNFHPTVSHIRKALNSNQPLKQNFVLYRDGDYQLNPEFSYQIDVEEFDALLSKGESARRDRNFEECIRSYESALKLYRGDFMQGSYEPWVEEQRSYYREQYLRLLEALAAVAQTAADWPRVMRLAQQIIHEDQFREDIHCLLMRAHAAAGNRGAVKDQYENLKRMLEKELGVEPSAETRKLYKELVGSVQ
ncbi:MAG TPA: BTAD domain-containing putative transcriptional regulator [Pyrinomonadaceae bacterium]|nr:BTAD domain-containing putative transcriptional regulator [Pyrinomonadaceae bacterium]